MMTTRFRNPRTLKRNLMKNLMKLRMLDKEKSRNNQEAKMMMKRRKIMQVLEAV